MSPQHSLLLRTRQGRRATILGALGVACLGALLWIPEHGYPPATQPWERAPGAMAEHAYPLKTSLLVCDQGSFAPSAESTLTRSPSARCGRVVDRFGVGVPWVTIGPADHDPHATECATSVADDAGVFIQPPVPLGTKLVALDAQWETLRSTRAVPGSDPLVVVAPRIAVAGRVVDAQGQPLPDALVTITLSADPGSGVDEPHRQWLALSDAAGEFAFPSAPAGVGARLVTQRRGRPTDERDLPNSAQRNLVIALADEAPRRILHGQVLSAHGSPLAKAQVWLGSTTASSNSDGTFSLAADHSTPDQAPMLVFAAGHQPTAVTTWWQADAQMPMVIALPTAQPIHGRALSATGQPLVNWFVALADPTPLDAANPTTAFVEDQIGSARVLTDASGAFRFEGAFARSYTLEVWDEQRSIDVARRSVQPGEGAIDIVVPPWPGVPLRGKVLTEDGRPAVGVTVGAARLSRTGAISADWMRFDHRATTDHDGTFSLPSPTGSLHLLIDGPGIVTACLPVDWERASTSPISYAVLPCRVVRFDGPAVLLESLSVAAVDDAGQVLATTRLTGTVGQGRRLVNATGIDPRARSLVLRRLGLILGQLPLPDALCEMDFQVSAPALEEPR